MLQPHNNPMSYALYLYFIMEDIGTQKFYVVDKKA